MVHNLSRVAFKKKMVISRISGLELFLLAGQIECLLPFSLDLSSLVHSLTSFLSLGGFSHLFSPQQRQPGPDIAGKCFPVNSPPLFRIRKVCSKTRGHSSDPKCGYSARLSSSLSHHFKGFILLY